MATSSIPAAIDYLVTNIRLLPECALPVIVEDGWPTRRADVGVGIGVIPGDGVTDDEVTHAQLGAQIEWERYAIPCLVWAHVGGTDAKSARDKAFAVYNAIVSKIRTVPDGRTLGGVLNSGAAAIIQGVRVEQTATASEAGEGRACEIHFNVVCQNRF